MDLSAPDQAFCALEIRDFFVLRGLKSMFEMKMRNETEYRNRPIVPAYIRSKLADAGRPPLTRVYP